LHQLSVWTFWNADRMREKMDVTENDQTSWVRNLTLTVRQDDTDLDISELMR
jgi:hypothetical protein